MTRSRRWSTTSSTWRSRYPSGHACWGPSRTSTCWRWSSTTSPRTDGPPASSDVMSPRPTWLGARGVSRSGCRCRCSTRTTRCGKANCSAPMTTPTACCRARWRIGGRPWPAQPKSWNCLSTGRARRPPVSTGTPCRWTFPSTCTRVCRRSPGSRASPCSWRFRRSWRSPWPSWARARTSRSVRPTPGVPMSR